MYFKRISYPPKRKLYFKYMDSTALPISLHHGLEPKRAYNSKHNTVSKKKQCYVRRTNVIQTTEYPSLKQVEKMTMRAPVSIQYFTHLVCIPSALTPLSENYTRLSYPFLNKSEKIPQEKTEKHKKNEQTVYATRCSSR